MRVITGTARGTALSAPEGTATRPTSDRLKENLFNILSPRLRGAAFLDLFSGSGAIGIEALSRGAAGAVFVESVREASAVIKKNLLKTRLSEKAEIFTMPVKQAIEMLRQNQRRFNIIFLDPPYDSDHVTETIASIQESNLLSTDGCIAAEMPTDKNPPEYAKYQVEMIKNYGDKKFIFWTSL